MRRRELILAAAAGTAATLAGPGRAAAQLVQEAGALDRAARLEHVMVFAYDAISAAGVLSPRERRLARRVRAHEAEHAAAVVEALGDLGWPLPTPPERLEQVEVPAIRAALGGMRTREDAHAAALLVEATAAEAYARVQRVLRDGRHLQLAGAIMAGEGQHLVAWRRASGRPLLPHAFEPPRR